MQSCFRAAVQTNSLQRLLLALFVILLSGCANTVRTQVSTFMAPEAAFGQGTIAVQPADEQLQDSLEFQLYKTKAESYLQQQGYRLAPPEQAQYIARLGYGVEEIKQNFRQPDIIFTTGFGHYYRRGGVGLTFSDYPRYEPEYLRRLALTITRTPDQPSGEPRRIYETTALSMGACPVMSVVFDEMLAAVFQNFPGENGSVKTVTVKGDASCH
jgi:hypothetical protein